MSQHYWTPTTFRGHARGNAFDGPTAAEQNWREKYGHYDLRGDEQLQAAAVPAEAQPSVELSAQELVLVGLGEQSLKAE